MVQSLRSLKLKHNPVWSEAVAMWCIPRCYVQPFWLRHVDRTSSSYVFGGWMLWELAESVINECQCITSFGWSLCFQSSGDACQSCLLISAAVPLSSLVCDIWSAPLWEDNTCIIQRLNISTLIWDHNPNFNACLKTFLVLEYLEPSTLKIYSALHTLYTASQKFFNT